MAESISLALLTKKSVAETTLTEAAEAKNAKAKKARTMVVELDFDRSIESSLGKRDRGLEVASGGQAASTLEPVGPV